jgi:hypothetical protein
MNKLKLGWLLKRYDRRNFTAGRFVIEGAGHRRTFRVGVSK